MPLKSEKHFKTSEKTERETIEVSQDDGWKIAKSPYTIETTGLGPCVGIIIYDPVSKEAIVGHFPDPIINNLNGMLIDAVKRYPDITKLKVYIGGGAPDTENAPDFTYDKAKRAYIKQQLLIHRIQNSQILTRYHDSASITIMRIDTFTGIVDFDEQTELEENDNSGD